MDYATLLQQHVAKGADITACDFGHRRSLRDDADTGGDVKEENGPEGKLPCCPLSLLFGRGLPALGIQPAGGLRMSEAPATTIIK
jgi:hypothetical protein